MKTEELFESYTKQYHAKLEEIAAMEIKLVTQKTVNFDELKELGSLNKQAANLRENAFHYLNEMKDTTQKHSFWRKLTGF